MMNAPQLPPDGSFTRSNINELQAYLNSLVPHGDNLTTSVDWDESGFIIKALEQDSSSESEGGSVSTVYPAIIKSGGNGVYIVDIVDADGTIIESGVSAVPTLTTGYNLPVGSAVVVYKLSVSTLG